MTEKVEENDWSGGVGDDCSKIESYKKNARVEGCRNDVFERSNKCVGQSRLPVT